MPKPRFFRVSEIMSRHTVTGGADFLEGVFFTTLIAYSLKFGQFLAIETLGEPETDEYMQCNKGVSEWYVGTHGDMIEFSDAA